MLYYGPTFLAMENNEVSRVEDYVATIMSEINQGYANTNIPLRAELLCLKPLDIDDGSDRTPASTSLGQFQRHFGKYIYNQALNLWLS